MRRAFYKYINQLFKERKDLVVLLGDIGVFPFQEAFNYDPSRIYNLGIMEQSMIGVASGLAKSGFVPVIHSIAPFITERCYEQLKLNLGYENVNCFLVSVGASYDYSSLGCSHHCPNDLRIVSSIPNFKMFCPGNSSDVKRIIKEDINTSGPKYIRLSEFENNIGPDYEDLDLLRLNKSGICVVLGNSVRDVSLLQGRYSVVQTCNVSDFNIEKLSEIIESNGISKRITVIEPCFDSGIVSKIASSIKNIEFIQSISLPKEFIDDYGSKNQIDSLLKLDDSSIIERLGAIYG